MARQLASVSDARSLQAQSQVELARALAFVMRRPVPECS